MLEENATFLGDEREQAQLAATVSSTDHLDSPRLVKCEPCGERTITMRTGESCQHCGRVII
jgi:hypothetical protein